MVLASEMGHRLWRNNSGMGWAGQMVKPTNLRSIMVGPNDVVVKNARPLHAGLFTGSPDLIGGKSIVVTQEMVGKRIMVFVGCEVKDGGRTTPEQVAALQTINDLGGIAFIARSEQDLRTHLA